LPEQDGGSPPRQDGGSSRDGGTPHPDGGSAQDGGSPHLDGGSPQDGGPSTAPFRFVSWGDTKSGTASLTAQSLQARALNPVFTIYCGDLQEVGFDSASIGTWRSALNGGANNGMFEITFAVRGNHDSLNRSGWQSYFSFQNVASRIGASHYSELVTDVTYSFDYGNAHFVGVDVPGDVTLMTQAQLTWIDNDLTQAAGRGLTHAFLFWHGPIYPLGEHCCSASLPAFVDLVNRHPIVSATFHGHEHVLAWVHINSSRYSNVAAGHEFEEFVTGDSGATGGSCVSGRSDYCDYVDHGFATVDVNGRTFEVRYYAQGNSTPVWHKSFTR
jgi:hypothetical protein